jgi:hypothetical protein
VVRTTTLLALLVACGGPDDAPTPVDGVLDYEALEPVRLLTRASLDLRGVRPSEAELDRLADDPSQLDALIAEFVSDDRLEDRVLEWFAPVMLTRTDAYLVNAGSLPELTDKQRERLPRDAGEEPLRVVARVVAEDLPWTEIVTGDWTMANKTLQAAFPVEVDEDRSGWQVAHYTDGRPAAGVLQTNGLWWRYDSTDSNANRKRANAISRILRCEDYLARPVDFDRTAGLLDEGFEDRTQSDPNCASCHETLDPMASYLYGFWQYALGGPEMTIYHPSREREWNDRTGLAPSYYGQPGSSLADLGAQLAADPQVEQCLAHRVGQQLVGRELAPDGDHVAALRETGSVQAVIEMALHDPAYRAATDDGIDGGAVPAKLADPALLASQLEALTGLSWEDNGIPLLTSDLIGYLTLAGGVDGYTSTVAAELPSPTILLVQERLAEASAESAVRATLEDPGSVALLDRLDEAWRPASDGDAMTEQLTLAHRRALGRLPSDGEVQTLLGLWDELYALEDDAVLAWAGTLSLVLRDPDFLLY